jgi:pimeloyl-ACP methyl ester carboxylesterase
VTRQAIAISIAILISACMPSFHKGPMPGEPKGANFAEVQGARVRYLEQGRGPSVVLLHGFASSLDTWKSVQPELARRHRTLSLDLKGFGWTDRPEGDYSPRAQAELVRALMDQRGIDRAVIVGHSWGASIALELALAHPARVQRLALYSAWAYEEQLPTTFHWARSQGMGELLFELFYKQRAGDKLALAFFDQQSVTEALVSDVEAALDRPGTTAAALAAVRGQRYRHVQQRYPQVTQRSLLLWGREDRVTPLEYGERLARELPQAKLVVYPRCGHFPMIEAPASTAELAAFVAERGE